MFEWKIISEKYVDFLRKNYEPRIPHMDYGSDRLKPFFGYLFETDDFVYVTQVSSPKPKHNKMKDSLDFFKIKQPNGRLIAVVNLNYMFPVPKYEVNNLLYKNIDFYVNFSNDKLRNKYIKLLIDELKIICTLPLEQKAIDLYNRKINKPDDVVSLRCFDFKCLEDAAYEWIETHPSEFEEEVVDDEALIY